MNTEELWKNRLTIRRDGQYERYAQYQKRNKQIGIPTIISSTIVGSAIFGTLGKSDMVELQMGAGVLSLVAATLAAVQTFLAYDKLSERSKLAADKYTAMIMKLEDFLEENNNQFTGDFKKEIRSELEGINKDAPPLPKTAITRLRELDQAE